MIENMPYTIEKEQEDFELKSAEEKERILGRLCFLIVLTGSYSLTEFMLIYLSIIIIKCLHRRQHHSFSSSAVHYKNMVLQVIVV